MIRILLESVFDCFGHTDGSKRIDYEKDRLVSRRIFGRPAQISASTRRRRFRPAHGGADFGQNFGHHTAAQILGQNFGPHTATEMQSQKFSENKNLRGEAPQIFSRPLRSNRVL